MRKNNICRLIGDPAYRELKTERFIYETDADTMAQGYTLTSHRMMLGVKGEGRIVFRNGVFGRIEKPFKSGELIFLFTGEEIHTEEMEEYIYIDFSGERAEELFLRFGIDKDNRSFDGFSGLIPLWRENISRTTDLNSDLASEAMLLHTFSRLEPVRNGEHGLVTALQTIAEESFSDPTLTLASAAERLNYNAKYLSHIFKKKKGIGFSEYLCLVRIRYAVSLFDHGIASVKNAALLSGFSDPLYFSSVFKRKIGVSPKEYILSRSRGDSAEI